MDIVNPFVSSLINVGDVNALVRFFRASPLDAYAACQLLRRLIKSRLSREIFIQQIRVLTAALTIYGADDQYESVA